MTAEALTGGPGGCPDPETLAAFLDGGLSRRERDDLAAHLTMCEICYAVVVEAAQTRVTATTGAPTVPWWRKKQTMAAAALAAAATVLLAINPILMRRSQTEPDALASLVAAVGTDRTIEPRLTGGFAYGPVRGPVRAGEPGIDLMSPDARIAAAQIEKDALAQRTSETLRALGISYLARGDAARAIPVLEEAADSSTPDARVLSDLAAAYLVRATREQRTQDVAAALTMADRAVKTDPSSAEAWFNRALALERLSLTDEAQRAWEEYLRVDSTSGWAEEARGRLTSLRGIPPARGSAERLEEFQTAVEEGAVDRIRALVGESPGTTREWLENGLLEVWPRAVLEGRGADADHRLDALRGVADALAAATGDRFFADAVTGLTRLTVPSERESLARAHVQFQQASNHYRADRIAEAASAFAEVGPSLARHASPFVVWAQLYAGIGFYYRAQFDDALREATSVADLAQRRQYMRVSGQALRVAGLVHGVRGNFPQSLERYRQASAAFERAQDRESATALRAAVAEILGLLGETDEAWSAVAVNLAEIASVADHRTRHNILNQAAVSCLLAGLPESAWHFQNALLRNALAWNRPLAAFDVHLNRGEILRQLGDPAAARAELDEASRVLRTLADAQVVSRNDSRLQLAQGESALPDRAAAAVTMLSTALMSFEKAERHWPIARVLLARGRAWRVEGDVDRAEADFTAGIELFERRRAAIASEALRSASFEQPWDLYTEMIQLQLDAHRQPARALMFAERSRARTLAESVARDREVSPIDPSAARVGLPPATTVLYYVELPRRILIWTLRRDQQHFVEVPTRASAVAHLLNRFNAELAARPTAGRDLTSLRELYDLLIRPVAERLPVGEPIVVIPDGGLHGVPFAALVRSEDRRYLVEDYAVQYSPSLTILLQTSLPPAIPPPASLAALVVGNPTVGADLAGVVPDLPEAGQEAHEVATCYTRSRILVGSHATKAAFLAALPEYDVIHFGGHAIANDREPGFSRLLLAADAGVTTDLLAREIAQQHLRRARLVVLGACRTNSGRVRRGEGVFSLARPFIAAGASAVLAALWNVEDSASRRLLVAFHRAIQLGRSPGDALRQAQLQLMGDTNPLLQAPSAWAGFTLIGGLATMTTSATPQP